MWEEFADTTEIYMFDLIYSPTLKECISGGPLWATIPYSGKVWRGESLANRLRFAKLKPSKLVVTIDNPLADLFIRQTFFRQTLEKSRFAKHSARQTFPLYGIKQLIFSYIAS